MIQQLLERIRHCKGCAERRALLAEWMAPLYARRKFAAEPTEEEKWVENAALMEFHRVEAVPSPLPKSQYIVFDTKRLLFIAPLKCASTSFRALSDSVSRQGALERNADGFTTIAIVRHPIERLISAAYHNGDGLGGTLNDIYRRHSGDPHFAPYAPTFEGFRINRRLRVEDLAEKWSEIALPLGLPPLERLNVGTRKPEQMASDYAELREIFAADFDLWEAAG